MSRYVVLPPVPALLPRYAGLVDPVTELRAACRQAVSWLTADGASRLAVVGDPPAPDDTARGVVESLAMRVVHSLLDEEGLSGEAVALDVGSVSGEEHVLVLANGSARRGEKAPGHLDERSFGFDDTIEKALGNGDAAALSSVDVELGSALMAAGIPGLRSLGQGAGSEILPTVLYAGDPFGVRYWVVTWQAPDPPGKARGF